MKFYGRGAELSELKRIRDLPREESRFAVVTGRRRVGKTELVERAFGDGKTPYLYFLKDLLTLWTLTGGVARY